LLVIRQTNQVLGWSACAGEQVVVPVRQLACGRPVAVPRPARATTPFGSSIPSPRTRAHVLRACGYIHPPASAAEARAKGSWRHPLWPVRSCACPQVLGKGAIRNLRRSTDRREPECTERLSANLRAEGMARPINRM